MRNNLPINTGFQAWDRCDEFLKVKVLLLVQLAATMVTILVAVIHE